MFSTKFDMIIPPEPLDHREKWVSNKMLHCNIKEFVKKKSKNLVCIDCTLLKPQMTENDQPRNNVKLP